MAVYKMCSKMLRYWSALKSNASLMWIAISCGLLINFYLHLISAINLRPLSIDSAQWFFLSIGNRQFAHAPGFYRYGDWLYQLPAWLIQKFCTKDACVAESVYSLSFGYTLHPYISLIITYFILKKNNCINYIIFPILSFTTITVASLAYSVVCIPGLLSYIWPVFFLILFSKNTSDVRLVWLFSLPIFFNHESSIGFFLIVILIKSYEIIKKIGNKKNNKEYILYGLVGIVLAVIRILIVKPNERQGFIRSLFEINVFQELSMDLLLIFIILILISFSHLQNKKYYWPYWVTVISGLIITLTDYQKLVRSDFNSLIWASLASRSLAMGFAFIMLATTYYCFYKKHEFNAIFSKKNKLFPLSVVLLSLFTSATHEIMLNAEWSSTLNKVESHMSSEPGCVQAEFGNHRNIAIQPTTIGELSVLLGYVRYNKIGTIVFSKSHSYKGNGYNLENVDLCNLLLKDTFASFTGVTVKVKSFVYDFTEVKKAISLSKANN